MDIVEKSVKRKNEHQKRKLPWYASFGTSVGTSLVERLEARGSLTPPTNSLSSFLGYVQDEVHKEWNYEMKNRMCGDDFLSHIGDTSRKELTKLKEGSRLDNMIENDVYDVLHQLRQQGDPISWKAVVSALSQREKLHATVARNLIEKMTDDAVYESFHHSKAELLLFTDISGELQKPVDGAYISQMEIIESTSNDRVNPAEYRNTKGAEFFYISQKPGQSISIQPLIDKLPEEIHTISTTLNSFADRIDIEVRNHKLEEKKFKAFIPYLRRLADALSSSDTSFTAASDIWSGLRKECARLSNEDGCPIIINPLSFVGEGGHIDIELLVGIGDSTKSTLSEEAMLMSPTVNTFALENGATIDTLPLVPFVFFRSLSHSGSNLSMSATANTTPEYISYNLSGDHKTSHYLFDTFGQRLLTKPSKKQSYLEGRKITTVAHELGHLFLLNLGHGHLGEGLSQNKLEELKADTLGALYFSRSKERTEEECRQFLQTYLIDYIDEIQASQRPGEHTDPDDSSLWYAFSGMSILNRLFSSGAITFAGNKIAIAQAKKGVSALADFGKEIIDVYKNESVTSKDVDAYVQGIEYQNKQNSDVDRYIKLITG